LEPLYIVRRLRDLMIRRQGQSLHLVFLDRAKAFDEVDLARLDTVRVRYGVPETMRRTIKALAASPEFVVAMKRGMNDSKAQTLLPYAYTPIMPTADI